MTDGTGAVYDLGYLPYEGERLGRRGARRTIFFDGVRRVLGLRRKARRKVLPWMLLTIAMLPPIAFVGVSFFVPVEVDTAFDVATMHSQFFGLGGTIVMLFSALAAPELLVPDRRDGVLAMLSSRPLTSDDYIGTRFASLLAIVAGFLLIPQLVLYIGMAATSDDGLVNGLIDGAGNLPKILFVAFVYVLAFVPLSFVVASIANRKAIAAVVFLAILTALTGFAEALVQNATITGSRWVALLTPINTADAANAWVFGQENPSSLLAAADIHPGVGVVALAAIGFAAVAFAVTRYRRLL